MFSSVQEVSPMTLLKQRMLEDLHIRNYAPTTVECYVRSVADFAKHFNKPPDQLGPEEIRWWQLHLLNEKRVKQSASHIFSPSPTSSDRLATTKRSSALAFGAWVTATR